MHLIDVKMRPMRTTVTIDDELLAEAKVVAARRHESLGTVIDDALRSMFFAPPGRTERGNVVLPTTGGSGLQPGVDLEDTDGLAEALGDNEQIDAPG